jgi:hypothetical protein
VTVPSQGRRPRPGLDELAGRLAALPPSQRARLVRRLKDLGVLGRRPRGERFKERNDRIEARHDRGLSPGQIARQEGMTRNAVRMVLYRRKRARHAKRTCALRPA